MAKKKNNINDKKNLDIKEEFDEELVNVADIDEVDRDHTEGDDVNEINEYLADPTKAVTIKQEEQDETEVVLYCPNCGVTGLFIDNVCMNCGEKKTKKSYSSADDSSDDLIDYSEGESINLDEF